MVKVLSINTKYLLNQPNTSMTVVKLLHQTEEARERNIENRTRHSKQWSHRQPELSNHGLLQVFA